MILVTLCMYKSVHLIFLKSMDGSESCATEMDFPMVTYFCFIEFHWSEEFLPENADKKNS